MSVRCRSPCTIGTRISLNDCIGILVSGWLAGRFLRIARLCIRPSATPNRDRSDWTALSNIASILCLSMLFSKISGSFLRTPLRRTLPQRSLTVHPGLALNDHSRHLKAASEIKRVIYTIAQFCALSNAFSKNFSFFFVSVLRTNPGTRPQLYRILRRTPAFFRTDII
jgi:hypothetical protein